MKHKIITSSRVSELNSKIEEMQNDGWEAIGEHKVVTIHEQKRFSGNQHKDTIFQHEYSQTMRKI